MITTQKAYEYAQVAEQVYNFLSTSEYTIIPSKIGRASCRERV